MPKPRGTRATRVFCSRRKGDVRFRSGEALWRSHESSESSLASEQEQISRRLRLPINPKRIRCYPITDCDGITRVRPMRSQIVIASRRNIRALPYAFTEQGVAMLSSVLRSPRAAEVNIAIMRTFVQLRRLTGYESRSCSQNRCTGKEIR
jgi:hypothetical protein